MLRRIQNSRSPQNEHTYTFPPKIKEVTYFSPRFTNEHLEADFREYRHRSSKPRFKSLMIKIAGQCVPSRAKDSK